MGFNSGLKGLNIVHETAICVIPQMGNFTGDRKT
jgi:hypothetical protein